jgi:hypothetical protein
MPRRSAKRQTDVKGLYIKDNPDGKVYGSEEE